MANDPATPGIIYGESRYPFMSLRIQFPNEAREKFIARMREYAEAGRWAILIRQKEFRPEDLAFELWRHDVHLSASSSSVPKAGLTEMSFALYHTRFFKLDEDKLPADFYAHHIVMLKSFLAGIEGFEITEEK